MEPAASRALVVVVSAATGLAIGSFLNVVVYRLPRGQSLLRPGSRCPSCGSGLGALENIPVVSWVALRGRCRHCTAPISIRYPATELTTGALFVAFALASPSLAPLIPLDALVGASVAIGAIDLDGSNVPAVLGWVALGVVTPLAVVAALAGSPGRLAWAGIGGGSALAVWGISRYRSGRLRSISPAACAAWGWAAGWTGLAGGLAVTVVLALLLLALPNTRRDPGEAALVGAVAVGTILAGMIAVP
jgi:leader peptidase (prepilin peptidase)/N-methyltransferase